ncbi:hypothetical protein [Chitinophaga pinensis]|uniref:hypothetical protein n=1 Tax=Chitinophaga pinensis TaxID=79329 RepID=UPI0021BD82CE|nr:hypothetical protein [Chitinophaga pinensis]
MARPEQRNTPLAGLAGSALSGNGPREVNETSDAMTCGKGSLKAKIRRRLPVRLKRSATKVAGERARLISQPCLC